MITWPTLWPTAVADRVMVLWDDEFTVREWNMFVDEEITRHANP